MISPTLMAEIVGAVGIGRRRPTVKLACADALSPRHCGMEFHHEYLRLVTFAVNVVW